MREPYFLINEIIHLFSQSFKHLLILLGLGTVLDGLFRLWNFCGKFTERQYRILSKRATALVTN